MLRSFLFLSLVFLSVSAFSQNGNRPGGGQMPTGRFYGKIVEAKTHKPIEYASVQLVKMVMDSATKKRVQKVVSGMLTPANGDFSLENIPVTGQSTLRVTIVGYKTHEQKVSFDFKPGGDMSAMMNALDKDLGNIMIEFDQKELEGVTVTASNPGLRLGIDRKVFSVDKNIVSTGGTAIDVMKNVPSVSVDLDGNVTMRNNAPQIFVDGRPTTMELDQIPADIIESVEIITNPSAKFDASGGTAGIINVVLKKNKKVGYNGGIRANIDSRARVGLGADINLRQNKVNMFAGLNFNQRKSISTGYTDRLTYGTPSIGLRQDDESTMIGRHIFGRAGFDYFIDNRNTISLTGNLASGKMEPFSTSTMHTTILSSPAISSLAQRSSNTTMKFNNYGTMLSYKRLFPKAGRELTADLTFNKSKSESNNLIKTDSLDYANKNIVKSSSQLQTGNGENQFLVFQTDFTNPINEKSKIEMGARMSIRKVDNQNNFYFISPSGTRIFNPGASVNYNSDDKVYAGYLTYSNQLKNFGYQLGLRLESSDYIGRLPDKAQTFNINFPVSLFPSVFLSNKMKNDQELQLNYARKINRQNFFQLYPYTDFSDSLNISRGNPDLKPEFTNSVELSYQKIFKKNKDNLLLSAYYKNTNDLIARYQVQEVIPDTVLINTYINASSSYVTGLEATLKNKINKWWDLTSNLNLFTSKINTGIAGQPDQDPIFSWFGKINNQFKLVKNLSLQVSGEYQSKTILPPGGGGNRGGGRGGMGMWGQATSSQGYQRENYFVDAGLKFDFGKTKQASISLNANDIFRTRRSDVHAESIYFTQDVFRRRDPQMLRLNFNWRFGKFDPNLFKRKNNRQEDGGMDTMGQ